MTATALALWLLAAGALAYYGDAHDEGRGGLLVNHVGAVWIALVAILPVVAFVIGRWWVLLLTFLPTLGVIWSESDCELELFCEDAVGLMFFASVVIGMPLVTVGVGLRYTAETWLWRHAERSKP